VPRRIKKPKKERTFGFAILVIGFVVIETLQDFAKASSIIAAG